MLTFPVSPNGISDNHESQSIFIVAHNTDTFGDPVIRVLTVFLVLREKIGQEHNHDVEDRLTNHAQIMKKYSAKRI